MPQTSIINANLVNEGEVFLGDVFIEDGFISRIIKKEKYSQKPASPFSEHIIDAEGKYLIPGIIDCHVHFREPGLTYKADIYTESKAAVAGGVTSFMEMPNTIPNATTIAILEEKYQIASKKSIANYSFFIGGNNNNVNELLSVNKKNICGIKLFLGASTGNMLTNNKDVLENIFSKSSVPIAVHCEDEEIIKNNIAIYKEKYGDTAPFSIHPKIRSEEACYKATKLAIDLAKKHNTRLHITHISTSSELKLLDSSIPLKQKKITTEVCPHYLLFDQSDYETKNGFIKCNPSIKTAIHKTALLNGLINDTIDIISTDHAPHTIEEKQQPYFSCPSGIASIEHSLLIMLEFYFEKKISLEKIVDKMCHSPAICYNIEKRGFIKEGYWADLVLLDLQKNWKAEKTNIFTKCGWSPYEETMFHSKITHTFVNGNLVFCHHQFNDKIYGKRLLFDR
jgi:dihydroorotase